MKTSALLAVLFIISNLSQVLGQVEIPERESFLLRQCMFSDVHTFTQLPQISTPQTVTWDEERSVMLLSGGYSRPNIDSLSVLEKIEFALYYQESFGQICSAMTIELDTQRFLRSYISSDDFKRIRSRRQDSIILYYRDTIIDIISSCLHSTSFLGTTEKEVVQSLNGYECIPGLIHIFNNQQDTELLTIFMRLMVDDKYPPFLATKECEDLFTDPANSNKNLHQQYKKKIPLTPENTATITTLAQQYFDMKMLQKK